MPEFTKDTMDILKQQYKDAEFSMRLKAEDLVRISVNHHLCSSRTNHAKNIIKCAGEYLELAADFEKLFDIRKKISEGVK